MEASEAPRMAARPQRIGPVLSMQLAFWSIFLVITAIGFAIIFFAPAYAYGPAMLLYVPLMITAIFMTMARFSGWHALSRLYRWRAPIPCDLNWRSPANMRWYLGYRGGFIGVGADERGLYLTSAYLLRPFNPPLFIPWKDLSVEEHVMIPFTMFSWRGEKTVFRFHKVPSVSLALNSEVGDELKRAANATVR